MFSHLTILLKHQYSNQQLHGNSTKCNCAATQRLSVIVIDSIKCHGGATQRLSIIVIDSTKGNGAATQRLSLSLIALSVTITRVKKLHHFIFAITLSNQALF